MGFKFEKIEIGDLKDGELKLVVEALLNRLKLEIYKKEGFYGDDEFKVVEREEK